MSYILDALRRAESERERRRGVPGLHTQAMPGAAAEREPARRGRPWLWVVVGISAGVLLPLLYRAVTGSEAPAENTAPTRAPVSGNVAAHEAAQAVTAAPASVPTAAASVPAPPAPATHTAAGPSEAAVATTPHTARAKARPTPRPAAQPGPSSTAHTTPRPDRDAGARSAAPAAAPPPAVPEPRLRTLAELPDDARRSVPQLNFGGSVYSEVPAQRMVIFNGQVLREGDAVTNDLVVEQIRPHSVVMRVRGERFQVTF